jgi:predicted acetyltransferase
MRETYGGVGEDDFKALAGILSWSFAFPLADEEPWLRRAGLENVRVIRRDGGERSEGGKTGTVAACLITIPHAQFFGGESVPAIGVAGVATPAETRGTGAAIALMKGLVRELHERGVPLSNLYPASLPLYRRVGYETAGARHEMKIALDALHGVRDRSLPLRPMMDRDREAVHACYRAHASRTNGWLDRGPYVWQRVFEPRGETARGFVVGEGDRIDGYTVFYEKRTGPSFLYSILATDLVARTPAAVRRLLTLFADHGTLADTLTWFGNPNDVFVHALPTVSYSAKMNYPWMLRVIDVARALEARGYPRGVRGALDLEIADDVIGANDGRFVLEVDGGRAEVKRGGTGAFKLDVRALAALYAANMTAHALRAGGAIDAGDDAIAIAESIFGAAAPTLADFF